MRDMTRKNVLNHGTWKKGKNFKQKLQEECLKINLSTITDPETIKRLIRIRED